MATISMMYLIHLVKVEYSYWYSPWGGLGFRSLGSFCHLCCSPDREGARGAIFYAGALVVPVCSCISYISLSHLRVCRVCDDPLNFFVLSTSRLLSCDPLILFLGKIVSFFREKTFVGMYRSCVSLFFLLCRWLGFVYLCCCPDATSMFTTWPAPACDITR